jgi:HEAT repeat protein
LVWLNETPGAASIALLASMQGHTNDEELLGDLPAAIGAHADTRTATPILARWATDTGSPLEFRRESVEALAQQDAPGVLAILAGIARRDPDETVRAEAVESIGEVSAAAAADTLLAFATSLASSHLRSEAVEALGDRTEPQIAGWLDQLARGNDSEVRGEALETLADLPAAAGLAKLTAIADDARLSSTLRLEAVEELGNLEAPKALETLRRIIFEEGDVSLQMKATETLGDLHGLATVEQLVKIAETHPQVVVQIEATETLSDMDEQEAAIRALNRLATSHPQVSVQVKAIETLGDFSNELATRSLMDYVMSENPEPLLIAAAEALGNVPPTTELLRFMERALTSGISEHVKIELVEALEDLGDAGRPLLRKMADSGSPSVRGKALEILTDN